MTSKSSSTTAASSKKGRLLGLVIAGVGLSHFLRPALYEPLSKAAFPRNTRTHIYANGGIETALGLGLATPKTRTLAIVGGIGYLAYLLGNIVRNKG